MSHSKKHAQKLLREIPNDPEELLRRPSYWDPSFVAVYLEHCDELLFHNPKKGLRYAQIAPSLALATVSPHQVRDKAVAAVGETHRGDELQWQRELLVGCHVVFGGALRAVGRLAESEATYQTAIQIAEGGIHPVERAKLNHRLAVLRIDQRRFGEASRLCEDAIKIYQSAGDKKTFAAATAILGTVYLESGRYAEAIDCCGEVLATPAADSRSSDAAVFNLAAAFTETKDSTAVASAQRWIRKARRAIRNQRRSLLRHKLSMTEGKLYLRLGLERHAERLFWRARKGFLRVGAPFELAMVSLDLSALLHQDKRWQELEELAKETYQRFRALSADTEAIAAPSMWMDAVRMHNLEDELLTDIRAKLEERMRRSSSAGRRSPRRKRR